jgi:hypothetical protein
MPGSPSMPPPPVAPPAAPPAPYREDGGCGPSLKTYEPPDASFGGCWPCLSNRCLTQLSACAAGCVCNEAIARALDCAGGDGNSALPCFGPVSPSPGMGPSGLGNDPTSAATTCLLNATDGCGCSGTFHNAMNRDASAGCILEPSGAGASGLGQCSSEFTETCSGTSYHVVCACPQATCVCSSGDASQIIRFAGCPYCPGFGANSPGAVTASDAFAHCGFPP